MKKANNITCENTKILDLFYKDSLNVQQLLNIRGGDGTVPIVTDPPVTDPELKTDDDEDGSPIKW